MLPILVLCRISYPVLFLNNPTFSYSILSGSGHADTRRVDDHAHSSGGRRVAEYFYFLFFYYRMVYDLTCPKSRIPPARPITVNLSIVSCPAIVSTGSLQHILAA